MSSNSMLHGIPVSHFNYIIYRIQVWYSPKLNEPVPQSREKIGTVPLWDYVTCSLIHCSSNRGWTFIQREPTHPDPHQRVLVQHQPRRRRRVKQPQLETDKIHFSSESIPFSQSLVWNVFLVMSLCLFHLSLITYPLLVTSFHSSPPILHYPRPIRQHNTVFQPNSPLTFHNQYTHIQSRRTTYERHTVPISTFMTLTDPATVIFYPGTSHKKGAVSAASTTPTTTTTTKKTATTKRGTSSSKNVLSSTTREKKKKEKKYLVDTNREKILHPESIYFVRAEYKQTHVLDSSILDTYYPTHLYRNDPPRNTVSSSISSSSSPSSSSSSSTRRIPTRNLSVDLEPSTVPSQSPTYPNFLKEQAVVLRPQEDAQFIRSKNHSSATISSIQASGSHLTTSAKRKVGDEISTIHTETESSQSHLNQHFSGGDSKDHPEEEEDDDHHDTKDPTIDNTLNARLFKPISSTASQGMSRATVKRPHNPTYKTTASNQSTDTDSPTFRHDTGNNGSRTLKRTKFPKSSTMPGFMERKTTGRHKAYVDGMRIVKESNTSNKAHRDIAALVKNSTELGQRRKANSEAMYLNSASVPDSLIAFTEEIHKEERITASQEVELATKTQEAIRLQNLFGNLENTLNREPTDSEWCAAAGKINVEALRQTIQDGVDAKNRLVTSNLRMVQGVVNVYLRNGLGSQYNAGDLMQEGILALIRAAEKFEPRRGFRFSTYAMYWIRAAIKRSQVGQSRTISVPQRLHENHRKITKVGKELSNELGRRPTGAELAEASGITETQLKRCVVALAQQCYSLDEHITYHNKPGSTRDRKKNTMYDLVRDKPDDVQHSDLKQLYLREELTNTLRRFLSPYEVDLLSLRFGLVNERTIEDGFSGPLTIAELSRLVGLKPDKVRRTINNSLRQLRYVIEDDWHDFERDLQ